MTASLSLVIPLFDVERYVPDLLASLSAQQPGDWTVDVVFVDDGSTDAGPRAVQRWIDALPARGPMTARLIRQANAGVSAARNRGLDSAKGRWVGFPDSDDVLDPGYLAAVTRFLTRFGEADLALVACSILRLDERAGGSVTDTHALRGRFAKGSRVVDIDREPDVFQLNVATAFFPREELVRTGMRFREGLHASEDALFVAEYLLGRQHRRIGLAADARYLYRKRARADSAVDGYRADPGSYLIRFSDGYLPLFDAARERMGRVPGWLQSTLLYEYKWLYGPQLAADGHAASLDDTQRAAVLQTTARLLRHVDVARLLDFDAASLSLEIRFLLLALKGARLPEWQRAYVDRVDARTGLKRVRLYGTDGGTGVPASAAAGKLRTPDYFGQRALHELIAWVPASQQSIDVGGETLALHRLGRTETLAAARDADRVRAIGLAPARPLRKRLWSRLRRGAVSKVGLVHALAHAPLIARRFRGVWVIDVTADEERMRHVAGAAIAAGRDVLIVTDGPGAPAGARATRAGSLAHRIAMIRGAEHLSARADMGSRAKAAFPGGRRTIRMTWVGSGPASGPERLAIDGSDVDVLASAGPIDDTRTLAADPTTVYTAHQVTAAPSPASLVAALAAERGD